MEWHSRPAGEAVRILKTDASKGLGSAQAAQRLSRDGRNILEGEKKTSFILRFFSQFSDFTVLILIAAAAVSFAAALISGDGDYIDPVIILTIVILNAVIGTVQESKAEKAIDALKKLSSPHAVVIREGIQKKIPSDEIVCGDILLLSAGDMVCADARLISSVSLCCDESSLTGEAVPSGKNADALLDSSCPAADRTNMVYASTFVTSGSGRAVVTETGMDTRIGSIAKMLRHEKRPETPLQTSLAKTGKILGIGALILCGIIFLLGVWQQTPLLEMFMISISLAVAAIPEGMPAVVTIVLAMGVRKLASVRAIVRRLPAVETLGRAQVICSDKTGTLTRNKMTVTELSVGGKTASLHSGEGRRLLELCALCGNASAASGKVTGEPTEAALLDAAVRAGADIAALDNAYPRTEELPFDSSKKYMATVHRLSSGGWRMIVKGAPDIVAGMCSSAVFGGVAVPVSQGALRTVLKENDRLASKGMRVIAAAWKDSEKKPGLSDVPSGLCLCGLAAMTDPPRERAASSVAKCRDAGIKTVMITGDHIKTAKAIAEEIGIFRSGDKAMTGAELDGLSDDELVSAVSGCSVFARVAPEHKVRIVKAFRSRGMITAMTGDGVNDAPALRCADIGCAMGKNGTEVAKSAADIILTDDNFATIVDAVEQGRGIYDNIKRSIHFLLSSNIGEILVVLCAYLMRLPAPLIAVQLLWVNLVTDSLPALALGAEKGEPDIMERPPEKSGSIFSRADAFSIITEGCFIGGLAFLAYTIGRVFFDVPGEPVIGRTMTFAVLSLSQLVHAFNLRSRHSLFKVGIAGNPKLLGAFAAGLIMQCSVITVPQLAGVFGTSPLSPVCWLIVAVLSLAPLAVVETEKLITGLRRQ